ncbi:PepSY domain-containing protein [Aneurinibacillus migulanus]|nr:PepSY domain-containing protein [Aneurinibacillus migulanus]
MDLEIKDGILIYEVIVVTPKNKIYEIDIHANTGQILKVEKENDYD